MIQASNQPLYPKSDFSLMCLLFLTATNCYSSIKKSLEKVDTSSKKSLEKVDTLSKKSLGKVDALSKKSLEKVLALDYTLDILDKELKFYAEKKS